MSERVDNGPDKDEKTDQAPVEEPKDDVQEQSEESFPASDPPSY